MHGTMCTENQSSVLMIHACTSYTALRHRLWPHDCSQLTSTLVCAGMSALMAMFVGGHGTVTAVCSSDDLNMLNTAAHRVVQIRSQCMHTRAQACAPAHPHTDASVRVCTYALTSACACMLVHECTHVHAHQCMHACEHTCKHTCMCVHTYTQPCIHACMSKCVARTGHSSQRGRPSIQALHGRCNFWPTQAPSPCISLSHSLCLPPVCMHTCVHACMRVHSCMHVCARIGACMH